MVNMLETDLCLGLPGGGGAEPDTPKANGKRGFSETVDLKLNIQSKPGVTVDLTPQNNNTSTDEENLTSKDPAKPPAK